MLRTYIKIGLTWAVVAGVVFSITLALPHREVTTVSALSTAFDLLVAISCFFVARNEVGRSTRLLFIYLCLLFSLTALSWPVSTLMGKAFFQDERFAILYWSQYHWAAYFFLLLFIIVFGSMEILGRKLKIYQKTLLSFIVAGIPFFFVYHPILLDPKHYYSVPDIRDFSALEEAVIQLKKGNSTTQLPTVSQLASIVTLPSQNGVQTFEQKNQRVAEIFPYLQGKNYVLLVYKPTYLSAIYMSIIGMTILLTVLVYSYKNDQPKRAYLEKLFIAFTPVCVLECIHAYSFLTTTDFHLFLQISDVGTILTRLSYGVVLTFIILRLNFILSPTGNFYENKLSTDPLQVSRWRDFFDEFIIRRFLNPGKFKRRLFLIRDASETPSSPTHPHQ